MKYNVNHWTYFKKAEAPVPEEPKKTAAVVEPIPVVATPVVVKKPKKWR